MRSIKRVSAIIKVQYEDQQTVPFFGWSKNLKSWVTCDVHMINHVKYPKEKKKTWNPYHNSSLPSPRREKEKAHTQHQKKIIN